jgi:hypothetical protein
MIGPSIAVEPRIASVVFTAGLVLKLRWVKRRWKPTGDAEAGGQVGDHEDDDVVEVQPALPRLPRRDAEADDRQNRDRAGGDAVAGLVRDRLHVVCSWRYGVLLHCRGHPFPQFWSP